MLHLLIGKYPGGAHNSSIFETATIKQDGVTLTPDIESIGNALYL